MARDRVPLTTRRPPTADGPRLGTRTRRGREVELQGARRATGESDRGGQVPPRSKSTRSTGRESLPKSSS
jgi:hypothetical protein